MDVEAFKYILIAFAIGIGVLIKHQQQAIKVPEDSALDGRINIDRLRAEPHRLEALAEKVSSVGMIQMEMPGGRYQEEYTLYEAFVVDSNGVPNTFIKSDDHQRVLGQARWLAESLGVPLDDKTY